MAEEVVGPGRSSEASGRRSGDNFGQLAAHTITVAQAYVNSCVLWFDDRTSPRFSSLELFF